VSARDYSEKQTQRSVSGGPASLRVPDELAGLRLDQALARMLPEHSRSRLQEWVKSAFITVDGEPAAPKDKVWGGERIEVRAPPDPDTCAPQAIPLRVMHEDAQILVVDKPAGLVVHPGSGNRNGTLLNALLYHAPAVAALPRAGIVHRLDKDTSGLLVVAKTLPAHTHLTRQLQRRSIHREYLAVVAGVPSAEGVVEAPIGRHPVARTKMAVVPGGKSARTFYRVARAGRGWSLLECRLDTGRTHQIRVHMHSIGHPVVGDPVYGIGGSARQLPLPARRFPRQALHAVRLELVHPAGGQPMHFRSPLPDDMVQLLEQLAQHESSG